MMKRIISTIPAIILASLIVLLLGCSNGGPTSPGLNDSGTNLEPVKLADESTSAENRFLIGIWTVKLDPVEQTFQIIPKRETGFHANIRYFLEKKPCNNCLRFDNVYFYPNDKVKVLVRITHPFDDPFLTGFDVRGVVSLTSTLNYPNFRLSYGVLENADGWTALWDSPAVPGTLNPYIAFNKTASRRIFEAGSFSTEWFNLDFSGTGWVFDYEVDASWDWPDGTNFPNTANMEEAYDVQVTIDDNLWDSGANSVLVTVDARDWQGQNTIQSVTAEAPDLFTGQVAMSKVSGSGNLATYELEISNDAMASVGSYPILIRATDNKHTSSNHLRAYQLGWVTVIHHDEPPPGAVEITIPSSDYTQYTNLNEYIYNITAYVFPVVQGIPLQWWWTDPDEPATAPAQGETGNWESDTNPNDNHRDDLAGIYVPPLVPESFPGPTPPAEYHYHNTNTNSQGRSVITFKVSTYGGDNYEIHVRRTDTMEEDTSPLITVKRSATVTKSSMKSSTGQSGYYLPDHSMMQSTYDCAYIDLNFNDHNLDVAYQAQLPVDANWLYSYCEAIRHPTAHEQADVGINRFENANVLGIALFFVGGDPAQHSLLATGRINEVYGPSIVYENSVFIHETGHLFGLDHVAQGAGVMEPGCTGKTKFCRASLTYLREDPAWD